MKISMSWRFGRPGIAAALAVMLSPAAASGPAGLDIPPPAAPRTSDQRDFGPSGQWSWGGKDTHILRGVHAGRAMDLIRIRSPRSEPLLVEDVEADHVRQFLDVYDKTGRPSIENLTIQRVQAGFSKRGIRLRYDSNGIAIRDFRLSLLKPNTSRGDIPVGIGLYDNVHNVVIERGVIENVLTQLSDQKKYWNADGISMERGVHDVVVRDVLIRNCTDGGIDSKAAGLLIDRVRVEGCGRNLRLWADATITRFESDNPIKRGGNGFPAHIALYNGVGSVRIGQLIVRAATPVPVFTMESDTPVTVTVDSQDIRVPAGTPLVGGKHPELLRIVWKSGPPRL